MMNPPESTTDPDRDPLRGSSNSAGKQPDVVTNPRTLYRFQRRQSERYFLETEYREAERTPTMDYPAGQSPWAGDDDVPGEALPPPPHVAPGHHDHEDGHANGEGWSAAQHQDQLRQPPQQRGGGGAGVGGEGGGGGAGRASPVAGEESRRPASSRYHNVQPPPQQRQHMPQYKLQAKITGLERSDKKDPILRFDVHV